MGNTEFPWNYRLKNGEPEMIPQPEPNWRSMYENEKAISDNRLATLKRYQELYRKIESRLQQCQIEIEDIISG